MDSLIKHGATFVKNAGWLVQLPLCSVAILLLAILVNILWQFLPRKKSEPPMVFHWLPFVGNAASYGLHPCEFYMDCRKKVCCNQSPEGGRMGYIQPPISLGEARWLTLKVVVC